CLRAPRLAVRSPLPRQNVAICTVRGKHDSCVTFPHVTTPHHARARRPPRRGKGASLHLDVVIPAHNEEARIGRTLDLYRHEDLGAHVRFVAALDGCTDHTAAVVRDHAMSDPRVQLLELPSLGKGGALMAAFRTCTSEMVSFVDADAATPPTE